MNIKALILTAVLALTSTSVDAYGRSHVEVMGEVVAITGPIYEVVPVGRDCYDRGFYYDNQRYRREYGRDYRDRSSFNGGTVLGGVIGGAIGSQIGDGRGRDAAIVAGTIVGASIGNDRHQRYNDRRYRYERNRHGNCEMRYEERIVGYNYIASFRGYRVHGQSNRRVYLGMRVLMLVPRRFIRR